MTLALLCTLHEIARVDFIAALLSFQWPTHGWKIKLSGKTKRQRAFVGTVSAYNFLLTAL